MGTVTPEELIKLADAMLRYRQHFRAFARGEEKCKEPCELCRGSNEIAGQLSDFGFSADDPGPARARSYAALWAAARAWQVALDHSRTCDDCMRSAMGLCTPGLLLIREADKLRNEALATTEEKEA